MTKLVLLIVFCISFFVSVGQILKDTSLANKQYFGALGTSLMGYNNDTRSYFSIYWQTGIEYNINKISKLGFTFSLLKFNWTSFHQNNLKYDKLSYFSASTDIHVWGRTILRRTKDTYNRYDKFIEYGLGYNCPYYFTANKYYHNTHTSEKYPNRYTDLYVYTTYYFEKPLNIPLGIKFEYHPFNFISNENYPNMAKFRIDLLINLFSSNTDNK